MSAHNYWLFFRPFARRAQRTLGVSEEGPDIVHSTPDARKNIISIVNSMWDTGIAAGMETLPSIIAPNSTVYRTDCHLTTVRHAKNISILFIWMKATDIIASNRPKSARYAVGFFIASDSPFQVTDLAYMLLRFQDLHIRDCDYQRFNLISLSYHICVDGTRGLLLYDNNLSHAYRKALHMARQNPGKFKSSRFGHPISTWPPDSES
ncbi:hypothetical protein DFH08DRAFT_999697, partial [Mycena albidolilacea]